MSDEIDPKNINDLPDHWFDLLQEEGNGILERLSLFPLELVVILVQVIFQNMIYSYISKENRASFLVQAFDAFLVQFEEWDKEEQSE
jgi:hypothetical protein